MIYIEICYFLILHTIIYINSNGGRQVWADTSMYVVTLMYNCVTSTSPNTIEGKEESVDPSQYYNSFNISKHIVQSIKTVNIPGPCP